LSLKLTVLGRTFRAHWLDTGVPHAVIFVPRVDDIDVAALGRAVRYHKAFGRAGANADFVALERKGLSVRTYERGVEDETLACGTGATAAALAASLLGRARAPVNVRVRSGQTLRVHFIRDGRGFKDVWLEGPVRLVYKGEISL
jgi:diaminopimelate epimerase